MVPPIQPIHTDADHEAALREIEGLMDARPGTARGNRLDVLATLVEAYEQRTCPVPLPDPIAAIRHHIESRRIPRRKLEAVLGGAEPAREVLARRRPLTMTMIRRLHSELGISADLLIQPYPLMKRGRADASRGASQVSS